MASLEKEQVLAYFNEVYTPLIRRARSGTNRDQNEREDNWNRAFPSRALSCFFLETTACLTPQQAALCDVDGGGDEGIDAIRYEPQSHELYLIQAKAGGDGDDHQPSLPDLIRFLNGAERLMAGDLQRFTELSQEQISTIRAALNDTALKVSLIIAHFGGSLDEQRTSRAEEIVNRYNSHYDAPRMRFLNFDLFRAHTALIKLRADADVNCRIKLHSYAKHDGRFPCYYGRVLASDLKALHDDPTKQKALYSRNVRLYRGINPVNEKVKHTILNEPANLFYLNNGVTALCSSFTPTPATAGRRDTTEGDFDAAGFVIINGAQTIGTIAQNLTAGDTTASVLLRVIIVGTDDDGIAERVAEASNHQTAVENIDFLSMHPCNERISSTLRTSGITYHTKRSLLPDSLREPLSFNLTEALEARVCAIGDPSLLAKMKGTPTRFHLGIRNSLETIFPDSLSARSLWREVQICRIADEAIRNSRDGQGRAGDKVFFTNGAYFLKHLILWKSREIANTSELNLTPEEVTAVRAEADDFLVTALSFANSHFTPNPDWNHVFKTVRTVIEINSLLKAAITTEQNQI